MKQYSEQELETKIQAFLARKQQQYPELAESDRFTRTVFIPQFALKLRQSLTSHNKSVLAHQ